MKDNKQCILVTGGAGYIGSHTCKALYQNNFVPVVFDNLSNGHKWAVKWGPLEIGDVRDTERLISVIHQYKPIAVMHFAASIEVGESVKDPEGFHDNNVGGVKSLLTAMDETSVRLLVFSSSCAVYGLPEMIPITEQCAINPINPYGENKAESESLILKDHQEKSLSATCLRYFNAAGADFEGELGEAHDPETHLIPIILDKGAINGEVVPVYGDDYDTPDGTCLRDYIHVNDLAIAHIEALKRLLKIGGFTTYNLGSGRAYSVKEILDSVKSITGKNINYQIEERREGDVPVLYAETSLASTQLGWQPRYSDLDSIISSAWRWIQEYQPK